MPITNMTNATTGAEHMKNFLLFLILIIIIAGAVYWFSPDIQKQVDGLLDDSGLRSHSTTVYKWQDDKGVWQYSQTPPADGIKYEAVEARTDVNVLPLPEKLAPK